MFKTFLLTLGLAGVAAAQVELMSNTCPTDPQPHQFYPDATVEYVGRATNSVTGAGIPGIHFYYVVKQYAGWGYHTHETDHGTFLSRPEPYIEYPVGLEGITDANGYANMGMELNGFAGGYTITLNFRDVTNQNTIWTGCVNNITRYQTRYLGVDTPLQRYSGGQNPGAGDEVNKSQQFHFDGRHVCVQLRCAAGQGEYGLVNSDGYTTRWVTANTNLRLLGASAQFKTNTNSGDLLDVSRASLPDGGVYDADVQGNAPGSGSSIIDWSTRVYEEHARGVEADIVIAPTINQPAQFAALYFAQCTPGINQPDGPRIVYNPPDPYWKTQGVMHVVCERAGLATKPAR